MGLSKFCANFFFKCLSFKLFLRYLGKYSCHGISLPKQYMCVLGGSATFQGRKLFLQAQLILLDNHV